MVSGRFRAISSGVAGRVRQVLAREIYWLLVNPPEVHTGTQLREDRNTLGLSLADVAAGLNTNTSRISRLEREEHRTNQLAAEYKTWLNQQAA